MFISDIWKCISDINNLTLDINNLHLTRESLVTSGNAIAEIKNSNCYYLIPDIKN